MIKITDNPVLKIIIVVALVIATVFSLIAVFASPNLFYTCYDWYGWEMTAREVEFFSAEYGPMDGLKEVTKINKQGVVHLLIEVVLCLLCVALLLYVLKLNKSKKAVIIIPIAYGLSALCSLLYMLSPAFGPYNNDLTARLTDIDLWIPVMPMLIAFIMVILNLFVFKRSHMLMIIAASVGLFGALLLFWYEHNNMGYFGDALLSKTLETLTNMKSICLIILYIAMLLCFIRKNAVSMAKNSPEKALLTLNQQLADGLITEEEYQKARRKVLMKL